VCDILSVQHCPDICLTVTNPFLTLLFRYRKIFHGIASRALSPGMTSAAVVSWVDVILAKLGETIVVVAAGFHAEGLPRSMPPMLHHQREEDSLWAASQLPGSSSPFEPEELSVRMTRKMGVGSIGPLF